MELFAVLPILTFKVCKPDPKALKKNYCWLVFYVFCQTEMFTVSKQISGIGKVPQTSQLQGLMQLLF